MFGRFEESHSMEMANLENGTTRAVLAIMPKYRAVRMRCKCLIAHLVARLLGRCLQ